MSPDGSTKPPPEEKLLKLIRGKEAKPAEARPAVAEIAPRLVAASGVPLRSRPTRWVTLASTVFGVIFIVEAVCLAIQASRPLPTISAPMAEPPSPTEPDREAPSNPTLPSLAASASPSLFASPIVAAPAPAAPTKAKGPSGSARALASRLTLMGIVAGEPAQAIIEDTQTNKTYFVTAGQAVVEGAVLDKVLDNRVILDLDGEKIELSL